VCTRINVRLDKVSDKLSAAGVPVARVRDSPGPQVEGVRLSTMHAMKGLEFRCVAVLGVAAGAIPFAREVTLPRWTPCSTSRVCCSSAACCSSREPGHARRWRCRGAGSPARSFRAEPTVRHSGGGARAPLLSPSRASAAASLLKFGQLPRPLLKLSQRPERGAETALFSGPHLGNACALRVEPEGAAGWLLTETGSESPYFTSPARARSATLTDGPSGSPAPQSSAR
jgi:hypothetical protein